MTELDVLRTLSALAQQSRLQIFRQLVQAGLQGSTPGRLSEALSLPSTALSFHLKELSHARLVTQERDGRNQIYRADLAAMNALLGYLTQNCCGGQPCGLPGGSATDATDFVTSRSPVMSNQVMNVLFICTHNSARSIMAEALLNQLGAGRFRAYSAGSTPAGQVNPKAIELLTRHHFRTGELRSKDWHEFAAADAPHMDFVLTVCDKAAGEVCPVWPGQPMSAHWGVPDPAAATGSAEHIDHAFNDAFLTLQRRISLFLNLPFEKLEKLSLLKELQDIGRGSHA